MPPRTIMWCKGRESKGEFKDENAKLMADKLMERQKQIKDGDINVEPVMDSITLVFGKEQGGFIKGCQHGVTIDISMFLASKDLLRRKLKFLKLHCRMENLSLIKKDSKLKDFSTKVNEQDETLKLVLAHLTAKGANFPNLPQTLVIAKPTKKPIQTKYATTTPDTQLPSLKSATPANTKPTRKAVEYKTSTINPETPIVSPKKNLHQPIKCSLSYSDKRNIVAHVTAHLSSERQFIH
ncbi:unnamed protein product [Lactuca saligna]|uniref:Uncharacterized protein n=1 Tax=Lactuca saligna TaxID=75948 RepID=A0AA35ZCJ6_LACSI|nr:unnamed protein product [Lactuca saligna]